MLKFRSGCDGGGKGALWQEDKSATLSTLQDQTLFQPVILNDQGGQAISVEQDNLSPTLRAQSHQHEPVVAIALDIYNSAVTGDTAASITTATGQGASNTGPSVMAAYGFDSQKKAESIGFANEESGTLHNGSCPGRHNHVCYAVDCRNHRVTEEQSGTLQAKENGGQSLNYQNPVLCMAHGQVNAEICKDQSPTLNCNHEQTIITEPHAYDMTHACDVIRDCGEQSPTLQSRMGTGGNQVPLTTEHKIKWIVRRLTPLECERLQGFPDGWTDIGEWVDSKGKVHKLADSPRYRALGNSLALPQWWWLVCKMAQYLPKNATLGSLFDGIGGFPLVWETCYGKNTARWASEIEEFPIAVTKYHFGNT